MDKWADFFEALVSSLGSGRWWRTIRDVWLSGFQFPHAQGLLGELLMAVACALPFPLQVLCLNFCRP
jgi:hypothetical protein